jgi:phenolic acid decarboxylase
MQLEAANPKDKQLWQKAIDAAKKKFDVYPSWVANQWAAKWYEKRGGTYIGKKVKATPPKKLAASITLAEALKLIARS